jgi:hypothetical protein
MSVSSSFILSSHPSRLRAGETCHRADLPPASSRLGTVGPTQIWPVPIVPLEVLVPVVRWRTPMEVRNGSGDPVASGFGGLVGSKSVVSDYGEPTEDI